MAALQQRIKILETAYKDQNQELPPADDLESDEGEAGTEDLASNLLHLHVSRDLATY